MADAWGGLLVVLMATCAGRLRRENPKRVRRMNLFRTIFNPDADIGRILEDFMAVFLEVAFYYG